MKRMYVVSPGYLKYFCEQSYDYTFQLQGYTDIIDGINGLVYLNSKDVYGFVYFNDKIGDDFEDLLYLIESVSMFEDGPIPFIIASKQKPEIDRIANEASRFKVDLRVYVIEEEVTDLTLDKIFKSIIVSNVEPYIEFEPKYTSLLDIENKSRELKEITILPKELLLVFDELSIKNYYDIDEAIQNDKVCKALAVYSKTNQEAEDYLIFRISYIYAYFGRVKNISNIVEKYKDTDYYLTIYTLQEKILDLYEQKKNEIREEKYE